MSARRIIRIFFGILLLAALVYYFWTVLPNAPASGSFGKAPAETPEASSAVVVVDPQASADVTVTVETVTPEPTPEPTVDPNSPAARAAALGLPAPPDIDVTSWEFILANETHNIEEYAPPELVTLTSQLSVELDSRIAEAMTAFVEATKAEGLGVCLSSGYRDYQTQKQNYEVKCREYPPDGKDSQGHWIVLPPGTSEHQTGLCCDITDQYYRYKNRELENTATFQFMLQHCHEYGFILRYPDGREDVTGVMYEPWHFRYVGVEAATYIMENGLCLEEFLALYGVE